MNVVVFDASTLILLANTDLLRQVTEEARFLIPPKVKEECLVKETFDAALIGKLLNQGTIRVHPVQHTTMVERIMADFRIARGEAEALTLARKRSCTLAVDDGPTIKACRIINQPFTTALHLLIHVKAAGLLDQKNALGKLEKLIKYGRYNQRIVEDARFRLTEEGR